VRPVDSRSALRPDSTPPCESRNGLRLRYSHTMARRIMCLNTVVSRLSLYPQLSLFRPLNADHWPGAAVWRTGMAIQSVPKFVEETPRGETGSASFSI
jgi:hypothetical protein